MNSGESKKMDRSAYLSISDSGNDEENDCVIETASRNNNNSDYNLKHICVTAVLTLCASFVLFDWINLRIYGKGMASSSTKEYEFQEVAVENLEELSHDHDHHHYHHEEKKEEIPMPSGVNIGSWLSLEDWFYVGEGAVEVATPTGDTAASCLPPLHVGPSTGPRWNSETDLLSNLTSSSSLAHALRVFHAHRVSYLDLEEDLRTLKEDLGVRNVRIPLTWCLTDYDPLMIQGGENEKILEEQFTCLDPFYEEEGVRWPAVPKSMITNFLRACAKHGIGAILDVHTYPGGTSIGTFSGVWPLWSRFWTHGDAPALEDSSNTDVGRELFQNFVTWIESLATEDPLAFEGLRGVSPMNEPAHLAGLYFGEDPILDPKMEFLPVLPREMADSYLAELNEGCGQEDEGYKCTKVPDGNHLRVLLWLRDATETFRSSSLPSLGKEMHMNIHESIFSVSDFVSKYTDTEDAKMHTIASWWRSTTTDEERKTWAILDVHHYHAWDPICSGTSDGPPVGNYTCSDSSAKMEALSRCALWASVYRNAVNEECGPGAKLASAEYSASTHHSVRRACNDVGTLKQTYQLQTEAAREADVELFWWSFKMPYGGAFRNAWSFKHLMFLLGKSQHPDESNYECNHVAAEGEPKSEILV